MEWGTKVVVPSERDAIAHVAALQTKLPPTKSAYVPSGKLPPVALAWLALGAGLGVPAGALAGVVLGAIAFGLVALIGLLIGAMAAACGRVLCIVVGIELLVALIGAGITFGAIGAVPAWMTAWMGRHGKNRNAWAAAIFTLPSALVAFVIVLLVPQAIALALGPADPSDDFALATLAHMLADPSWLTLALYGLGLVVTIGAGGFVAYDTVGQQKFCEPCERYMDESELHGLSADDAVEAIAAIRGGRGAEIAPRLALESGRDVAPRVFACPGCQRGYFEATAHAHASWIDAKQNAQDRTDEWLCASIETAPDATRALVRVKIVEDVAVAP